MATSNLLESVLSTTESLLAHNITAALAHAGKTIDAFLNPAAASTPDQASTWHTILSSSVTQFTDFLASRSSLENTSILLAISTFLFLIVRKMSTWSSRFGNLGRFSPFMRSPTTSTGGTTKVSDADFSYITADDLRKHQAESQQQSTESSQNVDYGPARDTDMLIIKNKKQEYTVHFPAYSIVEGKLTVGTVRDAAAKKTKTADPSRIKLLYKGRNMKDDTRPCKSEGLKDGSEILCSIAEPSDASSSDSSEDDADDGQLNPDGTKKKRNRGKKTKRRNRREATQQNSGTSTPLPEQLHANAHANPNLNIPSLPPQGRAPSPKPPASPATPQDKLNALRQTLLGFKADCDNFARNPPAEASKREFEYKKLSETILTQVLLKLDGVETDGDADARTRRKELVKETQGVLTDLDTMMKK